MITVYGFGSYFGLPDGSPFVTKAMLLLKLAGLEYRFERGDVRKAPKGKLPFIDDKGSGFAIPNSFATTSSASMAFNSTRI